MRIVAISNSKYPKLLKQIRNHPKKLYCKGDWDSNIFDRCLAVVGSRKITSYGKHITQQLVSKIAALGVTIVSGFMYGVDAWAHRAALLGGGRTIAVMPCGIDLIHPAYQKKLYEEILENGGLIISEFEGNSSPMAWTYPLRNRIVAGLSQATLVIEAGQQSGSLITAGFAKEYKRKLFAVPGPLTSSVSLGTLQLIKEGADMVISVNDILAEYDLEDMDRAAENKGSLGCNELERSILNNLAKEPIGIDILSRLVKVSASKLGGVLSLMQLRGLVGEDEGKYYVNEGVIC
jgi:DNA processing protein